jgi:serpin B
VRRFVAVVSLVAFVVALLPFGCGPKSSSDRDVHGPPTEEPLPFAKPANADRTDAADKTALAGENNDFALALYERLLGREGNLFFSPASVSVGLGMTSGGARGETAAEMEKVLRFPLKPQRLHPAFAGLLWDWHSRGRPTAYRLYLANSLWAQQAYDFVPDFFALTRDNYGASLEKVDFSARPNAAREAINAWTARKTNDRIKELIAPNFIRPETTLILVNAVYFKGGWHRPFKPVATKAGPFHVQEGRSVEVPFMHQTEPFRFFSDAAVQVLELPYVGEDLSMVVVLPEKVDGLAEVEKTLTPEKLSKWLDRSRRREVVVALPKFKRTCDFDLSPTLTAMGMPLAFDREKADFSGMCPRNGLYLGAVVHQATVEVTEEGTEAAAATDARNEKKSDRPDPADRVEFKADHPFLFLIRHRSSGSILFLGRVTNPQG